MTTILTLMIIGLPWIGALLVWVIGDKHEKIQHWLSVGFALAATGCAVVLLPQASSEASVNISIGSTFGNYTFVPDGLGLFLSIVATAIGSLAIIFSTSYMRGESQLGRYYSFVLFFIGAMTGLVLTSNIMLMFVFWENTALCSYALIAFHNDDPKAVRGGIKALLITSIGGVGLLFGSVILFIYTGSFDINGFLADTSAVPASVLGLLAFGFLIAAAAKSAQFPFQTWLPDAMEAPSPISALIHAATMVNAGVYLLARFYPAFKDVPYWSDAVMAVGMLSALLAAVMALVATDLKRVLAYSTVSQLGYMVYAVGAGSVFASQFHLMSHSIFKALLFLAAGAVIHNIGTRDMLAMGGVGKKMPFVQWVFAIGALALAGIPILNGFWSKELILENGLKHGPFWIYVIMMVVAGLTALYTLRCFWLVFRGSARSDYHAHKTDMAMKFALAPLAIGAVVSWLVVGRFSVLLGEHTLPFHAIEPFSLNELVHEVLSIPTLVAMAVIGVGIVLWLLREKLTGFTNGLKSIRWAAENSFGFEAVNDAVTRITTNIAEALRETHTGHLSWNVVGIMAAVVILFVYIVMGA
jgi:NADH-quinone oxidoreductase subunit L